MKTTPFLLATIHENHPFFVNESSAVALQKPYVLRIVQEPQLS